MTISLKGRKALVTGASQGIGRAIAERFSALGASVAVTARRLEDAKAVVAGLEGGNPALALALDVTDDATITEAVAAAATQFGGLDCLVNNAGIIAPIAPLAMAEINDWRRSFEVNLLGAYTVTTRVWPHLVEAGTARVINISSGAAQRPLEGWSAYCASKAALAMLSRSIDLEGAALGIRCFSYAPGVVDTNMQVKIRASGINPVSQLPRDSLSRPDQPAQMAAFLASGAADEWGGIELDIRDPKLRARAGLSPISQ